MKQLLIQFPFILPLFSPLMEDGGGTTTTISSIISKLDTSSSPFIEKEVELCQRIVDKYIIHSADHNQVLNTKSKFVYIFNPNTSF